MDTSCQQCLDEICNCAADAVTKESEAKKNSPGSKKKKRSQTKVDPHTAADATMVFVLGHLDTDTSIKQVDVYSGLNGYHIRSIPGNRWSNPTMLGAGAGYLAVVDHFQDYDLIRFTDEYAGADPDTAFDTYGFPVKSYDWGAVADIYSIATPTGTRAVAVTITPTGIALISLTSEEGLPSYLPIDIRGIDKGTPVPIYGKVRTLPKPFETLGVFSTNMQALSSQITDRRLIAATILKGATFETLIFFNYQRNRVTATLGIPSGLTAKSLAFGGKHLSVLTEDTSDGTLKVLRYRLGNKVNALFSVFTVGKATESQAYNVTQSPAIRDIDGQLIQDETKIKPYLKKVTVANERYKGIVVPALDPEKSFPKFAEAQTSTTLNDERLQSVAEYELPYNEQKKLSLASINVPDSLHMLMLAGTYDVVAELYNEKTSDGAADSSKPVFRLLHASSYDWYLDGGFTYGCSDSDGIAVGTTNNFVGESLAIFKGYTLGELKSRDLKVALINTDGRIMYRNPKALGALRVYSGDFPALDTYPANNALQIEYDALTDDINRMNGELAYAEAGGFEAYAEDLMEEVGDFMSWRSIIQQRLSDAPGTEPAKKTGCTTNLNAQAATYDGVLRTQDTPMLGYNLTTKRVKDEDPDDASNMDPVTAYSEVADCLDDPWNLFVRSVDSPSKVTLGLTRRTWTRVQSSDYETTTFYPEWDASNNDIVEDDGKFDLRVNPKTSSMLDTYPLQYNYTGRGGFYPLGFACQKYLHSERYAEELQALADMTAECDRLLDAENAKEEASRDADLITRLTKYKTENEGRVATIYYWLDGHIVDKNFQHIPRSYLRQKWSNVDITPTSQQPDEDGVWPQEEVTAVDAADAGSVVAVGEEPSLKRGCVMRGGPYAWIGLNMQFQADSMEGNTTWGNPEARRTGLGFMLESIEYTGTYAEVFGISSGVVYEAGYQASVWGEGAYGFWKYTLEAIGVSGEKVTLVATDRPHVHLAAPTEAQEVILQNASAAIGGPFDEIYQSLKFYYASEPIAEIRIKWELQHHAHDVYRWGHRTLEFANTGGETPICSKVDPGYLVGDNCEAAGCGNLTCGSRMMGSKGKLYGDDPIIPHTEQKMVTGEAIFTVDSNPYYTQGLAYGTALRLDVVFNLNNLIRGFDLNISKDS